MCAYIIYESYCLKAVELFVAHRDHILDTYAIDILHIRDILHGNDNTILVHILKEQNMCAYFMPKKGSHSRWSTN